MKDGKKSLQFTLKGQKTLKSIVGMKKQMKLLPFFSIFLDNGFSSEHYGTELHITEPD